MSKVIELSEYKKNHEEGFVKYFQEGEWINIFENGKKKVIEVFKNGELIEGPFDS